jgi:hypothetical protein
VEEKVMTDLTVKPEFSLFKMLPETANESSEEPSALSNALRLLSRIAGTVLAGIGVAVLLGNVLVGAGLLLQGPAFALELL